MSRPEARAPRTLSAGLNWHSRWIYPLLFPSLVSFALARLLAVSTLTVNLSPVLTPELPHHPEHRSQNITMAPSAVPADTMTDIPAPGPNGHLNKPSRTTTAKDLASTIQRLSQKYTNPALHVTPDHHIALQETEIPTPGPQEALVHVKCTGICGSDMHLWHGGRIGPLIVDRPCVLGHEPAGVVIAVGEDVVNVEPGDRVAIEPGVPCRKCWLCERGK